MDYDELIVSTAREEDRYAEVGVTLRGSDDWPWGWAHLSFRGLGFVDPVCFCCGFYLTRRKDGLLVFGSSNCSFNDDAFVSAEQAATLRAFCRKNGVKLKTTGIH